MIRVFFLLTCINTSLSFAQTLETTVEKPGFTKPFTERVAIFEYLRGNQQKAILLLSENSGLAIGEMNAINRDLFRLEQLQKILTSNLNNRLPDAVNDDLWLKIADLRRRTDDCHGAVSALAALKSDDVLINHRQLFQRISCMLSQHNASVPVLHAAEKLIPVIETPSIWLAYIYNNMAVKAQQIDEFLMAQRYFKQALRYVDQSEEGQSLASFIQLSLGYSYFSDNRFNFALKTFADLKETTEWIDLALLGFGWSAYRNGQAGLALEAWRQLVRLPFQSIHLYEGLIAIPFALEQQNAYVDAFYAYETAITEFQRVDKHIEQLEKKLTKETILQHVLDYSARNDQSVKPLDPLLVYAYAEASYQDVFDTIAQTQRYLEQIQQAKLSLDLLNQYQQSRQFHLADKTVRMEKLQNTIEIKLAKIQKEMVFSSNLLLIDAFKQQPDHPMYPLFKQFDQLSQVALEEQSLVILLKRMRGVLMGRVHEDQFLFNEGNHSLVSLTQQFDQLNKDYTRSLSFTNQAYEQHNLKREALLVKLNAAEIQIKQVQYNAVTLLKQKTIDTLALFQSQLSIYATQAQIALTRLSENFYQEGGQQL